MDYEDRFCRHWTDDCSKVCTCGHSCMLHEFDVGQETETKCLECDCPCWHEAKRGIMTQRTPAETEGLHNEREVFYRRGLEHHLPDKAASVLVCGGGAADRRVFLAGGFTNVTITNLATGKAADAFGPYGWARENAEALSYEDNAFDFTVIHAAVHHASSPHRVLTELYRVARYGVLVFEARDSFTIRVAERLGLSQRYEHAPVSRRNAGGVNDTDIPNFIYRWTEREIEKTISSYAPMAKHQITYLYGTAFPASPALERGKKVRFFALRALFPIYRLFVALFPRQQNLFCFFIQKPKFPRDLHPWLETVDGRLTFRREWGARRWSAKHQ